MKTQLELEIEYLVDIKRFEHANKILIKYLEVLRYNLELKRQLEELFA